MPHLGHITVFNGNLVLLSTPITLVRPIIKYKGIVIYGKNNTATNHKKGVLAFDVLLLASKNIYKAKPTTKKNQIYIKL